MNAHLERDATFDPEIWRSRISARLEELIVPEKGEEPAVDVIAARLLEAGCTGGCCGGDCPLYHWIHDALAPLLPREHEIWVTRHDCWAGPHALHLDPWQGVLVPLPSTLQSFINAHDGNGFPELTGKSRRSQQSADITDPSSTA